MTSRDPLFPASDNLDDWFPRERSSPLMMAGRRLGVVVGGSLSKGLDVKLDRETVIEDLAVGRYVVVRGQIGQVLADQRIHCRIPLGGMPANGGENLVIDTERDVLHIHSIRGTV